MEEKSIQGIIVNDKLEKLFIAARNARDTSDAKTAIKHYEEISMMEPNNWEALFYLVILKTETIKYGEISNVAISVCNCIPKVFNIIDSTIQDPEEKKSIVKEVAHQCSKTAAWLITVSGRYYNELTQNDLSLSLITAAVNLDAKRKARYESAQRMVNIGNILCICGNSIEKTFGLDDKFYQNLAIDAWKAMLLVHFEHIKQYKVAVFNDESVQRIYQKIKKIEPSYELPKIKATEKRNYTITAILIALGVFVLTALWCLWIWFL